MWFHQGKKVYGITIHSVERLKTHEFLEEARVDMKSSVAAFLVALKEIILEEQPSCSFVLLITSDEEGDAEYGTKELLKWVIKNNEVIDDCIVGEPTSSKLVGDTIKIGRRGSLSGFIVCKGKQGHIAYPEKAVNPVEELIHFIGKLKSLKLDNGSKFFDPSSLNISTIDTNNKALNVIPENCYANFNVGLMISIHARH